MSFKLNKSVPPYNLNGYGHNNWQNHKRKYKNWNNAGYDSISDAMPNDEYIKWQQDCLIQMYRLIKPTGAIFYNHKWRRFNKRLIRLADDITSVLPVRQIIIWNQNTSMNVDTTSFMPAYEVIYLIAKEKFRLKKGKQAGSVWNIKPEKIDGHPANFPVELVQKAISNIDGRVVFDPFIGSGTTAIAALKEDRSYIGIDISKKYCEMARSRVEEFKKQVALL